jgi:hypothetical protein
LQGVEKSYAEVVQGLDHTLSLNFQTMAKKSKVGEAALKKSNGRNSLVDTMSAEMEEKEKNVIMTRVEQVGVVTVCDMISKFKKYLLKSLESFSVGWTLLVMLITRLRKRLVLGGPSGERRSPNRLSSSPISGTNLQDPILVGRKLQGLKQV